MSSSDMRYRSLAFPSVSSPSSASLEISSSAVCYLVSFLNSMLLMVTGQWIWRIHLRQVAMNVWIFFIVVTMVLHVSALTLNEDHHHIDYQKVECMNDNKLVKKGSNKSKWKSKTYHFMQTVIHQLFLLIIKFSLLKYFHDVCFKLFRHLIKYKTGQLRICKKTNSTFWWPGDSLPR